ncbi:MAG: 4-hydroxy-tetrahydrodipicolinate reductase [Armatimonadetes bacterium]|nr:4-hydroxy-tetrahydrodipicolinate reductase [Armatimonadota bacterium]
MSEPIRVLVLGAAGRMGRMVTAAVEAADGLEAVGAVDLPQLADGLSLPCFGTVAEAVAAVQPQVAIDFTHAEPARLNLPALIEHGVSPVIGTTGLSAAEVEALGGTAKHRGIPAFLAPNFAIGAVLMMRFAGEAAKYFDYADVIEYHHENKRDAPSGTAAKTLEMMLTARGGDFADTPVDEFETIDGARGGGRGFAHVHSVRMPGFVADQDVLLGGPGENLRISHRSLDRGCFMPGVVLAAKRVLGLPAGLTVGLDAIL